MNRDIDELIKQDLKAQSHELDSLVNGGLHDYLKMGFTLNFNGIMKLGYGLAIVLTLIMVYCGYQFFTADDSEEVFWGVCLILSFNAQVATKLWVFMQTNRNILSREMRILLLRNNTLAQPPE